MSTTEAATPATSAAAPGFDGTEWEARFAGFPASVMADEGVQSLIALGQHAYALRMAVLLNGNVQPEVHSPRNPLIAWECANQSYDPHMAALEMLGISPTSDHGMSAIRSVRKAGDKTTKQDSEFIKDLVFNGMDRDKIKVVMADCRAQANAYAKAMDTGSAIAPHVNPDTMAAFIAMDSARKERDQAIENAKKAYNAEMSKHKNTVRAIAVAVRSTAYAVLDSARLHEGKINPVSLSDLSGFYGRATLMAYRHKDGRITLTDRPLELINAIIRDQKLKLQKGHVLIAGENARIEDDGLIMPGKAAQAGLSFLSHDEHGAPIGGFALVSGEYKGGSVQECAMKGNGQSVHLTVVKPTDTENGAIIKAALESATLAVYARVGNTESVAGDHDLIVAIRNAVTRVQ